MYRVICHDLCLLEEILSYHQRYSWLCFATPDWLFVCLISNPFPLSPCILVAAANAIAEERRNQSGFSTLAPQSSNAKSAFKPVIDGSVLKNDIKQRLAKERREEKKRQEDANKEIQLLEKERKSKILYEKQMEEKQRRLREQKAKDEQRRISAERKRKEKFQEERERLKAILYRTLERSSHVDRQKRWSWEGCTGINSENKTANKHSISTEKLEQGTSGLHKQVSVSSTGLQNPVDKKATEKRRSSSLNRRCSKLHSSAEPEEVESKTSGIHSIIQLVNMPLRSQSSVELKSTIVPCKSTVAIPSQEKAEISSKIFEAVPKASVEAPAEASVETPPEASIEASPEASVEAPSEASVEASPEASVEAPPEASVEAPPEASVEAPPEESVEAPSEASVEAPLEASVEAPPEASVEAPPEASVEAPLEASVEAPLEASIEAPLEASVEASLEASLEGSSKTSMEAPVEASMEVLPKSVETSPEASMDPSPDVSMDSSPGMSVDPSPEVSTDSSPEVNVDPSLEVITDSSPEVSLEVLPEESEESLEASPEDSLELLPELTPDESLDVPPKESLDVLLEESLDVSPKKNLDVPQEESLDVTPEESLDVLPKESLDVLPEESLDVSPKKNLDVPQEESLGVTPEESLDIRPEGSLEVTAKKNLDVPQKESVEAPPEVTMVKAKDCPPQKSEMDKQASNSVTKKRLPPSQIPCYKWSSSPTSRWRPPSPINAKRQIQKNRPPSPSPVTSKPSTQVPFSYKVIPIQRTLFAQNASGTIGMKSEAISNTTNNSEAASQNGAICEESGNKSTPGPMSAKEATKILAEKRRLAREQKEKDEERLQKEMEQRKMKGIAKRADEGPEEEFSNFEDVQQPKEIKKKEESQDPEDKKVQLQKGDAKIKAQEEADKRKKEHERIMLQNLQERLERKKRIEEIMKRTRKPDSNTSKAADTASIQRDAYEEDEADDEDEPESDDDSFDDMRPPAFINGMDPSTTPKAHFKNVKNTRKLEFLDATSSHICKETKTVFNCDMKTFRHKSVKDTLSQIKSTRSSTKRTTSRAAKTGKAKTSNTMGPSKSLRSEAQEWICDKITDITSETEPPMSSIPPDSHERHLKGSVTSCLSAQLAVDNNKRNKSVSTESDM
uniref:MAP7 domain-containing protein 3 n=1 Tax=Camelus bactrianus TaxID=9837 RepID=A0A9W3HGF0_CAMBA|nr:MAP7 domain-containing protein 3 [Camelus bactrianus]